MLYGLYLGMWVVLFALLSVPIPQIYVKNAKYYYY